MRKKIDCFLACQTPEVLSGTIAQLRQSSAVRHIFLMVSQETDMELPQDCTLLVVDQLQSSQYVMQIAEHAVAPYVLLSLKSTPIVLGDFAQIHRFGTCEITQIVLKIFQQGVGNLREV